MPTQTNQSAKHANLLTALGAGFEAYTYESAWHAYWDDLGSLAPGRPFDERMLLWINGVLSTSYTNLPRAMQAYAVAKGAYSWSSLDDLDLP